MQAYHVIKIHEGVIDSSDLDVRVLESSAKHKTTDAAETVNTDFDRHVEVSLEIYSEKR